MVITSLIAIAMAYVDVTVAVTFWILATLILLIARPE